MLTAEAV